MFIYGFHWKEEKSYWDKETRKKITKVVDMYESVLAYTREGAYKKFKQLHRKDNKTFAGLRYGRERLYNGKELIG